MALDATSIAAAVAAGAKNVQFAVTAQNLPHKIVIIGGYDDVAKPDIVEYQLYQVTSPEDSGDKFGFGAQAHRLTKYSYLGSDGVETWVLPVAYESESTEATGTLTFVGTISTAGTLHLYISGEYVPVTLAVGDDATAMATKTVAAVTADADLPVTAGNVAGVVTFTSKDALESANDISLKLNLFLGQELPEGITSATIVDMAGGTGVMDLDTALAALGTGDDANEKFFTEVIHGNGDATVGLDSLSTYNGIGNDFVGCWANTVHRPFRSITGDVTAGSTGLTNAKALGNGRKLDRTNGQICVPGSPNHPNEIAALTMGLLAKVNQNRVAEHMVGKVLPGIIPGALADRWTNDYDNRNDALKAGVSPTIVEDGAVKLQNVATFYHPDNVPVANNGYRSQISISKLQNILYNQWLNFAQEKWLGNALVGSVANVSNTTDRQKAKDRQAVIGDLVALATQYESKAWIYTAAFTIEKLQAEPERVSIRPGTTGFDILFPVILSGEAGIFNNEIEFDTSIAVLG
jgi:phage tail sheath gpL-like